MPGEGRDIGGNDPNPRSCPGKGSRMTAAPRLIPLWIKIAYTAFTAVLIPVYLRNYGPTNFLYFCDVTAIMTVIGIWIESPLLLSAPLVGIFLPQMLWVLDFFFELSGGRLT